MRGCSQRKNHQTFITCRNVENLLTGLLKTLRDYHTGFSVHLSQTNKIS